MDHISNESIDVEQAYLHFGRHTEAGKLVYALYSAKQKLIGVKVRKNSNPSNPYEQHLQSLKQAPKRVSVKVPKPIKKKGEEEPRFPIYGGRKPAGLILRETKELFSKERMRLPVSHPVKSRSETIADLQVQFSGEVQHDSNPKRFAGQTCAYETHESVNEATMSQLYQEIEERQQFLQYMQALDKKAFEHVAPGVQAEIRQRVTEIQTLSQLRR